MHALEIDSLLRHKSMLFRQSMRGLSPKKARILVRDILADSASVFSKTELAMLRNASESCRRLSIDTVMDPPVLSARAWLDSGEMVTVSERIAACSPTDTAEALPREASAALRTSKERRTRRRLNTRV